MYIQLVLLLWAGFILHFSNMHSFLKIDGGVFLCQDITALLLIIIGCMTSFILWYGAPFILWWMNSGGRESNTLGITTLSFILDCNVLTTRLGCKVEDSNFKKVNAFKTRQSDFTEGNYCILLVKQLTSLQDEKTGMPENLTVVP